MHDCRTHKNRYENCTQYHVYPILLNVYPVICIPNNICTSVYPQQRTVHDHQEKSRLKELCRGGGSRLTQSYPGRILSKPHQSLMRVKASAMRQPTRYDIVRQRAWVAANVMGIGPERAGDWFESADDL